MNDQSEIQFTVTDPLVRQSEVEAIVVKTMAPILEQMDRMIKEAIAKIDSQRTPKRDRIH